MESQGAGETAAVDQIGSVGPWGPAFAQLSEWDPAWAAACVRMTTDPWTNGVLSRKTVELICIALAGAERDPAGVRRHIRAALDAGAGRDEILATLETAFLTSIRSSGLAHIPIGLNQSDRQEYAQAFESVAIYDRSHDDMRSESALAADMLPDAARPAGRAPDAEEGVSTPLSDKAKAADQWTEAFDLLCEPDPAWTDAFTAAAAGANANGAISPKFVALLGVALDGSDAQDRDALKARRRIAAALESGATPQEIREVLKLCAIQGVEACNLAIPILAEELGVRLHPDERPRCMEAGGSALAAAPDAHEKKSDQGQASAATKRNLKDTAVREFKRFLAMFLYLWVILGLFVLQQSIVLAEHHIDYKSYGFAFLNALVLAKVMLLADNLRLGSQFKDRPLIFPIVIKSLLFATVFVVFHIFEKTIVGLFEGKTFAQSIPALGGGSVTGALLVGLIISVSLVPFFAFAEIGRVMEKGELAKLIFTLDAKSDRRARGARPGV